jgi:NAD(P)-dependent dehydrogenase (short-subunit alcohol dehydrogenase family)
MFEGKTVLVTGATSGIGFATVRRLLDDGATVIAVGRNPQRLADLDRLGGGALQPLAFDLTEFARYREVLASVPALDGLVHSAGIVENNPLRFFSLEAHRRIVAINQTAPLALVAELARGNKLKTGSAIVLLSSILGPEVGIKGTASYAGTKAALVAFAKVMALELAHKGIRVNCVAPGMVQTELVEDLHQLSEEALRADRARYPLGKRYATAQEVAAAIRFLLSPDAAFMTGQTLVVDGGFTVQ